MTSTTETSFDLLEKLGIAAKSPRALALLRIDLLTERISKDDEESATCIGLAAEIHLVLKPALDAFFSSQSPGSDNPETTHLQRILQLSLEVTQLDTDFKEEFAREGFHGQLLRLLKYDIDNNNDHHSGLLELQDLAYEISASDPSFPQRNSPFSVEQLRQRLPLIFSVRDNIPDLLIHQVTGRQSSQHDVGYVLWPSAVLLARYIIRNPDLVLGDDKQVLELGAGCGLLGLTAAMLRQQHRQQHISGAGGPKAPLPVILTDFNTTVLDNLRRNVQLNNLGNDQSNPHHPYASVLGLDFYDQSGTSTDGWVDLNGTPQQQVHLVLAADIVCQREDAYRAANTIHDALLPGGQAIYMGVDAAHRFGVEYFVEACQKLHLEIVASKTFCTANDNDNSNTAESDDEDQNDSTESWWPEDAIVQELKQTSGYIGGYHWTMLIIDKPKL